MELLLIWLVDRSKEQKLNGRERIRHTFESKENFPDGGLLRVCRRQSVQSAIVRSLTKSLRFGLLKIRHGRVRVMCEADAVDAVGRLEFAFGYERGFIIGRDDLCC
jgi:hypothetical protein